MSPTSNISPTVRERSPLRQIAADALVSYVYAAYIAAAAADLAGLIWSPMRLSLLTDITFWTFLIIAPLDIPILMVWGFGHLIQYGNKSGENYIVPATTAFLVIWSIVFSLRQFRRRRRAKA